MFLQKVILTLTMFTSALALAAAPELGKPAPAFKLKGADGKTYELSQFKGKTVVLEWFNKDCPYVRKFYDSKTMQGLQKDSTTKGVVWLTVSSSAKGKEGFLEASAAKKISDEMGMASTALLLDNDGKLGSAYHAQTTPHMFVIDKNGLLAYQGAIDDHPSANPKSLAGAQNYVTAALLAVNKPTPEPVKTSSTTPYGCSVKY